MFPIVYYFDSAPAFDPLFDNRWSSRSPSTVQDSRDGTENEFRPALSNANAKIIGSEDYRINMHSTAVFLILALCRWVLSFIINVF
ncbi:hypothetical protein BDZ91DRAFT_744115, partial [Kalaharituber pfeilii]